MATGDGPAVIGDSSGVLSAVGLTSGGLIAVPQFLQKAAPSGDALPHFVQYISRLLGDQAVADPIFFA
jgi:hypothetical protein